MLAHLPLLFHPKPDTVLVIGLGCGVSLGAAEQYPVKSIDCVELLGNVVRASKYFNQYNHDCLADPRVNLIVADARNHIMLADRKYDVIISEPTNPWIQGVGDLFTEEFFKMAARRLKPGGIICAWFHTYHMGDSDLRSMAKTFLGVFPHSSMWMVNESDVIFLGASSPLKFDRGLVTRMESPQVRADLKRIFVDDVADILSAHLWGEAGLARYTRTAWELHTDDNMMLEFSAARKVFQSSNISHLSNFLASMELPPLDSMGGDVAERVRVQMDARKKAIRGTVEFLTGKVANGIALYDAAFAQAPSDPYVLWAYTEGHLTLGYSLITRGDYKGAAEAYAKVTVEPEYPRAWMGYDGLAFCAARTGDPVKAQQFYETSLAKNPYNRSSSYNLARLLRNGGHVEAAISIYRRLLDLVPGDPEAANSLARIYATKNENLDEALALARTAVGGDEKAAYLTTLGRVYFSLNKLGDARKALDKALKLEPNNTEALLRLGLVELTAGSPEKARRILERLVGLGARDEYTENARGLLREMQAK
jgi:spermidine synthase